MSVLFDTAEVRRSFEQEFPRHIADEKTAAWRQDYIDHLALVRDTELKDWMRPDFQRRLWDDPSISGIGRGPIDVSGAFQDADLARRLFDAREAGLPEAIDARAAALQTLYNEIINRVYPRYADRRPRAKIARLLAALFPADMTCLLNGSDVWGVQRLIGAARMPGDFIAENPAIRAQLREILGTPTDLAGQVDHSIFTWFLWREYGPEPERDAVVKTKPARDAADLPALSVRPANAQRRSLTCVKNNVDILIAMVREAEQGISRTDLLAAIQREAPDLNQGSASILVSQAQGGLGLIRLDERGVYRPTEWGLDLLTAPKPAHALRVPLVNRVFGMGHLLLILGREPGLQSSELSARLRDLVPTWTSLRPGTELIQWALATELVRAEAGSVIRLHLTEDGEDYLAALPDAFEDRWRIEATDASQALTDDEAPPSPRQDGSDAYGPADILADGCFLPLEDIEVALALLRRKKNLILQGAPGTGKTWLAKRLGFALIGARDEDRLQAIQFQPSMSYEDFVRGWRPGEDGRLELVDGVFLEAIHQAKDDPDRPYVLVIEEINRGNPSQIFGELLTLLENDKRNPSERLRLAYGTERVYVPENLHVIGTMNIADRSLALVDLALRRRFAFLTLTPAFGEAWRTWCVVRVGMAEEVVDRIRARMATLNNTIAAHKSLGETFRVGHSYVTPDPKSPPADAAAWFREVVATEIGPLLEEYWYDDTASAQEAKSALLIGL